MLGLQCCTRWLMQQMANPVQLTEASILAWLPLSLHVWHCLKFLWNVKIWVSGWKTNASVVVGGDNITSKTQHILVYTQLCGSFTSSSLTSRALQSCEVAWKNTARVQIWTICPSKLNQCFISSPRPLLKNTAHRLTCTGTKWNGIVL